MTDENKINILNYITGNYQTTNPDNQEVFLEQSDIARSTWTPFMPQVWNNFKFEGMVAPNESITNIGVLYGGYIDSNNQVKGIIILFDTNFIPIKTIFKYDSGADLRYIQYMKQADDGTFYFIDDTAFSVTQNEQVITSQKRFVLVNNFTLKNQLTNDYAVHLRTSYILNGSYVNFYCKNMYKDPNSSHYIFFGAGADSDSNHTYRIIKIFGLKINVGAANEWTMYVFDPNKIYGSSIATFNGNNVRFRCITTDSLANNKNLILYSKTYTGNATASVLISFGNYKPYIDDIYYKKQSVFLDYDNVYFVQNNQRWSSGVTSPKYIGLYKYNFTNSQLTTIYEKSLGSYVYGNVEAIYIDSCNTDIYIQYNTNIDNSSDPPKADYYFQRLVNDTWNPILILTQKNFFFGRRTIFVKANYNLLQAYLYGTNPQATNWIWHVIKEDYNSSNYNSTEYNDYNSMIGTKGEIYSNNSIVFARNLYNRTSWNNTTTSTMQIPNGYLNDIVLQPKKLLSYSNNTIVNDTEELVKNTYENVLLNFVNSITVLDEDTNILYPDAATYINTGINIGTQSNSEDIQISKVRVNYENGSVIQPITWADIPGENAKQTSFSLYISSPLTSIDFISDDETFIFLTKEYNNYTVGNIYTITQKIRVE